MWKRERERENRPTDQQGEGESEENTGRGENGVRWKWEREGKVEKNEENTHLDSYSYTIYLKKERYAGGGRHGGRMRKKR